MKPTKSTRRRLVPKELLLIAAPFPFLWLVLGFTVDGSVFRFWQSGQSISPLRAMELGWIPLAFTFFYLLYIGAFYRRHLKTDWLRVVICALLAYLLAAISCPIP